MTAVPKKRDKGIVHRKEIAAMCDLKPRNSCSN